MSVTYTRTRLLAVLLVCMPLVCLSGTAHAACESIPVPAGLDCLSIVKADGQTIDFAIEVADTDALRKHGLMFRRQLPEHQAMLLLYPQARRIGIWMKNTFISLDIIFIASDGTITRIAHGAAPKSTETIPSPGPALAVLEINGGQAGRLGIKVGDQVVYPVFGAGAGEAPAPAAPDNG